MYSDMVLRACPISMADRKLFIDLIVLDMDVYEIILSRDWLSKYHARIDYRKKVVVFQPLNTNQFVFKGIHTSSRFFSDFSYENSKDCYREDAHVTWLASLIYLLSRN